MKEKITLTLTAIIHFLVDLTCIYYMNGVLFPMAVTSHMFLMWAVYYNFCAFALPALVGYLADRFLPDSSGNGKNLTVSCRLMLAAAGCLLVAPGWFFFRTPVIMITLIGIGNGMFHVGAGMEVLHDSRARFAPPGMFIATGAVGVFLGTTWGRQFIPLWKTFTAVMFLCAVVLVLWSFVMKHVPEVFESQEVESSKAPVLSDDPAGVDPQKETALQEMSGTSSKLTVSPRSMTASVVCCLLLFFVVFVRSYYGGLTNYAWKTGFEIGLIFTLCVAGGKFCGGILADKIGIKKAVCLSLGAAGPAALLSFGSPVAGCISIFFFNMTMPLTLSLLVELMPRFSGFAFGLLMFALFLGTLPGMLFGIKWFSSSTGLLFLCLLSMAVLIVEIRYAIKSGLMRQERSYSG